ncbi:MAG: tRNA dihydrouridine synthase DusB [Oscillospiraceae bacterium]
MRFGNLEIPPGAALAPMAGATDTSMRCLAAEYGASYAVSEMVSAKALTMGDAKSRVLMRGGAGNALYGIQLFGSVPQDIANAVRIVEASGIKHDFIDINMGCPAPKITGGGAGSALLKNPKLAQDIAKSAVDAAHCPVTVKLRIGWDNDTMTGAEVASLCEDVGIAAVVVHARTREEMYTIGVHYDIVADIKHSLHIPVIVNGDINSADTALSALAATGCDGVMIGRAAMGNPWIFAEVKAALSGKSAPLPPTLEARYAVMRRNIADMCNEKGEHCAMQQARSHAAFYMHGLKGAAELRRECCALTHFTDIDALIDKARLLNR